MSFDDWIKSPESEKVRLKILVATDEERVSGADTLLHVPLLALTLLAVAQYLRGEFRTAEISAWAAAVLSERAFGDRRSFKRYAWSVELRARCADALVFLEAAGLVAVTGDGPERWIELSDRGRSFVEFTRGAPRSANLLEQLSRACRAAHSRGVTLL